jgi:hypothetical protein
MSKYFLILIFICGCSPGWKKNLNSATDGPILTDSIIISFRAKYDLLLISNIEQEEFPHGGHDYFIIGNINENWQRIYYHLKEITPAGEPYYTLRTEPLKNDLANSILSVFTKNKIWNIGGKDEGCVVNVHTNKNSVASYYRCSSNPLTHQSTLMMITKTKIISKTYRSPEFFESTECCPGNIDRQIFMKCESALLSAK